MNINSKSFGKSSEHVINVIHYGDTFGNNTKFKIYDLKYFI